MHHALLRGNGHSVELQVSRALLPRVPAFSRPSPKTVALNIPAPSPPPPRERPALLLLHPDRFIDGRLEPPPPGAIGGSAGGAKQRPRARSKKDKKQKPWQGWPCVPPSELKVTYKMQVSLRP